MAFDHIRQFWAWFVDHEPELAAATVSESVLADLEKHLFAIKQLDWEIGPGVRRRNLFALSPRGNSEDMQITRSIIAQAPALADWEFYPAKPPRRWKLKFLMTVDGKQVQIDGAKWEFIARPLTDGTYDLVFRAPADINLPREYLDWAAMIIADGELGEETRMELVENITTVSSWDKKDSLSARRLEAHLLLRTLKGGE